VQADSIYAPWIEYMAEEKIIDGNDDGNYYPDDLLTRTQMIKYMTKAFNLQIKKKPNLEKNSA